MIFGVDDCVEEVDEDDGGMDDFAVLVEFGRARSGFRFSGAGEDGVKDGLDILCHEIREKPPAGEGDELCGHCPGEERSDKS